MQSIAGVTNQNGVARCFFLVAAFDAGLVIYAVFGPTVFNVFVLLLLLFLGGLVSALVTLLTLTLDRSLLGATMLIEPALLGATLLIEPALVLGATLLIEPALERSEPLFFGLI